MTLWFLRELRALRGGKSVIIIGKKITIKGLTTCCQKKALKGLILKTTIFIDNQSLAGF
jgi:hypothetical protein